jgi:hypothetical protein
MTDLKGNTMNKLTPIIVTSYTGDPNSDDKKLMLKKLMTELNKLPNYVVLVSHSPVAEDVQNLTDATIYERDNSFDISGQTAVANHGVAEFRSMQLGVNHVKYQGYTDFLKICFDTNPNQNFTKEIEKCLSRNKSCVTSRWGDNNNTLSNLGFYSTVDFYERSWSRNELYRLLTASNENAWFDSCRDKNLLDEIYIEDWRTFFHYSYSYSGGAKLLKEYADSPLHDWLPIYI